MKKQIMIPSLVAIVAVSMGVYGLSLDTLTDSEVRPEPSSIKLGFHGNIESIDAAKSERFVADAKESLSGLELSSVRTSEFATYVYYAQAGKSVTNDIELTQFVKDGGIMIETYEQPMERKLAQLAKVKEAGLEHVKHFEIQGHPAFGYPMDGITPTLLKIFPKDTDQRITLASGGSLDDLVRLADRINLS